MSTDRSTSYALLSIDEYLRGEQQSNIRHEYIGGQIYAKVGASAAHNLISGNLFAALHRHLAGGPCRVFMSDMKLRLRIADETIFYYLDILVCCEATDREKYFRENPRIIVEVLSEATARIDRREKLTAYQHIDSLQEYVLIEQDWKRATLIRRSEQWKVSELSAGDELHLSSLGFSIAINALYANVEFGG